MATETFEAFVRRVAPENDDLILARVAELERSLAMREWDLGFTGACSMHGLEYARGCGACAISRRIAAHVPVDAGWCSRVRQLEAENARLREALTDAIGAVTQGRRGYAPNPMYAAQIGERTVERWRAALRAAGDNQTEGS